jgi:hypothetical protein
VALSPEWQLVLAGTRSALDESGARTPGRDLLTGRLDWGAVADIAFQHRVAPLLYRSLQSLELPRASEAAMRRLKQAYIANGAHNAALFRLLRGVLDAFAAAGIPVMVLKGAMLANTVYPERALRPMNDIDLLVREETLDQADAVLRRNGFEAEPGRRSREALKEAFHHWRFRSRSPGLVEIPVELHWRLDPPSWPWEADLVAMWQRAAPLSIAGAPALVLAPEDLLLSLCLHICRHRFRGGLISLCDIAAVTAFHRRRIDWEQMERRATEWRAASHVAVVLGLAADLLEAAIPRSVLTSLGGSQEVSDLLALARERTLEHKGTIGEAGEVRLRWRRRWPRENWAVIGRTLSPGPTPVTLVRRLLGYAPLAWSLVRHPRAVDAIARRQADKSKLDAWCSPEGDRSVELQHKSSD